MFLKKFFSNRFKCLRQAHFLSSSQCANLLGFKSKGSIANIESGKFAPLVDNLIAIGHTFAVSLDWLCGESNIPYTPINVYTSEVVIWEKIMLNMNPDLLEIFNHYRLPDEYRRDPERENRYSLQARANIVFLVTIIFMITSADPSKEIMAYTKKIEKTFSCPIATLLQQLFQQSRPPIFDLSAQPVEMRKHGLLLP